MIGYWFTKSPPVLLSRHDTNVLSAFSLLGKNVSAAAKIVFQVVAGPFEPCIYMTLERPL